MGRISVPVQDLKDTAKELQNIGDLIGNSATLYNASGGALNFGSGTLNVVVHKAA